MHRFRGRCVLDTWNSNADSRYKKVLKLPRLRIGQLWTANLIDTKHFGQWHLLNVRFYLSWVVTMRIGSLWMRGTVKFRRTVLCNLYDASSPCAIRDLLFTYSNIVIIHTRILNFFQSFAMLSSTGKVFDMLSHSGLEK